MLKNKKSGDNCPKFRLKMMHFHYANFRNDRKAKEYFNWNITKSDNLKNMESGLMTIVTLGTAISSIE